MTPEQAAAYVFARAVAVMAKIEAMKAANADRESHGKAQAWPEEAFFQVADELGIGLVEEVFRRANN